jgi:hypothetical protein
MAAQLAIDRLVGAQKALQKYTTGLALRGRDLRYAGLEQADMRKADLRSADLQGADLRGARLSRATIGDDPDRDDSGGWLSCVAPTLSRSIWLL